MTPSPARKKAGREPKPEAKQELPQPEPPRFDDSRQEKRKRKPAFDENLFVMDMKRWRKETSAKASPKQTETSSKKAKSGSRKVHNDYEKDKGGSNNASRSDIQESTPGERSLDADRDAKPTLPVHDRPSARSCDAKSQNRIKPILLLPEIIAKDLPDPAIVSITNSTNGFESVESESTVRADTQEADVSVQEGEDHSSAEFLKDEFLTDSLQPEVELADVAVPKPPAADVPKLNLAKTSTPIFEPGSDFATPTVGKKRGRKKKTLAVTEIVTPTLESQLGRRIRKKIDYRELSGETATDDIERSEKTSSASTLEAQTSLNESLMTPEKPRRGRKRKVEINSSNLSDCDVSESDVSKTAISKRDVSKSDVKQSKSVPCGKCETVCASKSFFEIHVAANHGGIVSFFVLSYSYVLPSMIKSIVNQISTPH